MDTKDKKQLLALDDLYVGQKFQSDAYKMTAAEITKFAREFDPQVFHTDEEGAKNTFFKGLAASGWHTAGVSMRLVVASIPIEQGLIGASADISWPRPTRPGDILQVESEVVEITPSRSRPHQARVTVRSVTRNQDGETLQILTSRMVAAKRGTSLS